MTEYTDPEDIRRVLGEMADEYKANRTPEQAMTDEMIGHWQEMLDATIARIEDQLVADGWVIVSTTASTNGETGINLWRRDLADAWGAARGMPPTGRWGKPITEEDR